MANRYYVGGTGNWVGTFTSQYPPAYNSTYFKFTSDYYGTGWNCWNPANSLIGTTEGYLGGAGVDARVNVDLGEAKVVTKIYYENYHYAGSTYGRGTKDFTLWGSNSATAFANTGYAVDTDWTQLTCDRSTFEAHVEANQADPKYLSVTNSTAYRYYSIKFASAYTAGQYRGMRRLEFQTGGGDHWSDSSGGAPNATFLPTSSDDAIFDEHSNEAGDGDYTVTINASAVCANLTFANPPSGVLTLAGASAIDIYGNLTMGVSMVNTYIGTITFKATSGTKTITSNAIALLSAIVLNGSGGTFQLADDLSTTGNLTNTAGTFDPNGKTVTLPGTQQTITGVFAFYNLTRIGTATITDTLIFAGNFTIANVLTLTGNSATNLLLVGSADIYTRRTITVNGSVAITNVKFRGVVAAGSALPFMCGAGCQNMLGNSGIVFSQSYIKGLSTTTGL